MHRNTPAVVILMILLIAVASPAHSGSLYYGFGLDIAGIESEQPFIGSTSGFGLIFNGGYRFNENISLDVVLSSIAAIEESSYFKLNYSILGIGPKIDLMSVYNNGWSPWAAFYLTSHNIGWDFFPDEVTGTGVSFAFGADFRMAYFGVIQVALRTHSFDGKWNFDNLKYNTDTTELTVGYIWHMWQ